MAGEFRPHWRPGQPVWHKKQRYVIMSVVDRNMIIAPLDFSGPVISLYNPMYM